MHVAQEQIFVDDLVVDIVGRKRRMVVGGQRGAELGQTRVGHAHIAMSRSGHDWSVHVEYVVLGVDSPNLETLELAVLVAHSAGHFRALHRSTILLKPMYSFICELVQTAAVWSMHLTRPLPIFPRFLWNFVEPCDLGPPLKPHFFMTP